jgi:hypothetical protein
MAEITVETILEYIGRLSAADRVKLFAILTTKALKAANGTTTGQKKSKPLPIPVPDPEPSRRWMAAHRAEYAGQWVALSGDRLIASGATEAEDADARVTLPFTAAPVDALRALTMMISVVHVCETDVTLTMRLLLKGI